MAANGPRLCDQDLFALIMPKNQRLKEITSAADKADMDTARRLFCEYLRTRETPTWHPRLPSWKKRTQFNRNPADRVVNKDFTVCHVRHRFTDSIDWFYNATRDRSDGIAYTKEWMWQLGRHGFWATLGRAYHATGDEKYARAFADQLESWITQCPRPDDNGNYEDSAWRTIEAGLRMGFSWPQAFHDFLHSRSFTDYHITLFVKSCAEHAMHLINSQDPPRQNNWVMMEMCGLYTAGTMFPELRPATQWRKAALKRLREEQVAQFLDDGVQFELTPGYHNVSLTNIFKVIQLANVTGRAHEIPTGMIPAMEKAYEYNMYIMSPENKLPAFNDSSKGSCTSYMKQALELFPERRDFRWVATDGAEGERPGKTSVFFPRAGQAVMRTGWETNATALYFDNGPVGASHIHQDKLSITLWACGREILFDAGGGMYDNSRYRDYDTDTHSHNTILVDGLGQRREMDKSHAGPVNADWKTTPVYDYANGTYDQGYGNVDNRIAAHFREVLFLKPDIILIADRVTAMDNKDHAVEARWHLRSTETVLDPETQSVSTADPHEPNVCITPLLPGVAVSRHSAVTDPELIGWYVKKNQQHEPATTLAHSWKSVRIPSALTLIRPLQPGQTAERLKISTLDEKSMEVVFERGKKLRIQLSDQKQLISSVSELNSNGNGEVIRQFPG